MKQRRGAPKEALLYDEGEPAATPFAVNGWLSTIADGDGDNEAEDVHCYWTPIVLSSHGTNGVPKWTPNVSGSAVPAVDSRRGPASVSGGAADRRAQVHQRVLK